MSSRKSRRLLKRRRRQLRRRIRRMTRAYKKANRAYGLPARPAIEAHHREVMALNDEIKHLSRRLAA